MKTYPNKIPLFYTKSLSKKFGGLQALLSLNISVYRRDIYGIIGPNGAGKTTLLNIITGLLKSSSGQIFFSDERIDELKPQQIFEKGISRTFQEGKIIPDLNVLENIMTGLLNKNKKGRQSQNIFYKENKNVTRSQEILRKFNLQSMAERWAEDLVWYERQLVQIARAVASEPKLLLLDEPTAGMGSDEVKKIGDKLIEINKAGVTIMLVSHDIQFIRRIANRIAVLDFGQKVSEGNSKQVLEDSKVQEVYLGSG